VFWRLKVGVGVSLKFNGILGDIDLSRAQSRIYQQDTPDTILYSLVFNPGLESGEDSDLDQGAVHGSISKAGPGIFWFGTHLAILDLPRDTITSTSCPRQRIGLQTVVEMITLASWAM
jgi:hypothetical protein